MLLEQRVQLGEIRAFDIPMKAPALYLEHELVGENRIENSHYSLSLRVGKIDIDRVGFFRAVVCFRALIEPFGTRAPPDGWA